MHHGKLAANVSQAGLLSAKIGILQKGKTRATKNQP